MEDLFPTPSVGFDLGSTSWHSYPSIYNLGHKAIDRLFSRQVIVEEKVDGSQFSFGWFPEKDLKDGLGLLIKSKKAFIHHAAPPAMFRSACDTVLRLKEEGKLVPGWTYRGEVLAKKKSVTLDYDRTPKDNIIIFDINPAHEAYLGVEAMRAAAKDLGLESVPVLFVGDIADAAQLRKYLDQTSILGGQPIEGVVIKPWARDYFGEDKKLLMGKFVSEQFREAHSREWGKSNPSQKGLIQLISADLNTTPRFMKAVTHLREQGLITDSPADIGILVKEIQADVIKEEKEAIQDALWKAFSSDILRGVIRGFPQWYKETLLTAAFEKEMSGDTERTTD